MWSVITVRYKARDSEPLFSFLKEGWEPFSAAYDSLRDMHLVWLKKWEEVTS